MSHAARHAPAWTRRVARRGHGSSVRSAALFATMAALGCGPSEPFPLVNATGTVTYEDGGVIPAKQILVRFESLEPPKDPKTHPRPGQGYVDVATGRFEKLTTYQYADGLIRGRHKALVVATPEEGEPLPVPEEYGRADTTPLEIDATGQAIELRVRRPD